MPVMEISIVPIGTGHPSVSDHVAEVVRVLRDEPGITYELCPMGTVVEADSVDTLFAVARKMHAHALGGDVQRIVTSIKIDVRTDKKLSMRGKIAAVHEKL